MELRLAGAGHTTTHKIAFTLTLTPHNADHPTGDMHINSTHVVPEIEAQVAFFTA